MLSGGACAGVAVRGAGAGAAVGRSRAASLSGRCCGGHPQRNKGGCSLASVPPQRARVCVSWSGDSLKPFVRLGVPARLTCPCVRTPACLRQPRLPAALDSGLRTWRLVTAGGAARFPALATHPGGGSTETLSAGTEELEIQGSSFHHGLNEAPQTRPRHALSTGLLRLLDAGRGAGPWVPQAAEGRVWPWRRWQWRPAEEASKGRPERHVGPRRRWHVNQDRVTGGS